MKKIAYLIVCLPLAVFAQGNPNIDMQKMMAQAQKAQSCMQDIDPSTFDKLEQEGKKMKAAVKSLCADGKRDQAQKKARNYVKEIMNRPEIKKMQECGEMLRGMVPKMPFDDIDKQFEERHVCDEM